MEIPGEKLPRKNLTRKSKDPWAEWATKANGIKIEIFDGIYGKCLLRGALYDGGGSEPADSIVGTKTGT